MSIFLLMLMIIFIVIIALLTYTVYIDQDAIPEYKHRMYVFYAALIMVDASIGVAWWIFLQNGG